MRSVASRARWKAIAAARTRPVRWSAPRRSSARKYEAGFVGIHWPKEWGGRGGTQIQNVIYNQEEAKYDVLSGIFGIGIHLAMPTICTWGTPEQRERFVQPTMRADVVWCQLFSEPSGGSDLAALRTRAERDGDEWVINGQKIWNSGAHYSDFGILVARSDPNVPKHAGLTFFILDMKTPGVEMRPIRQLSGSAHFNEVFFTNVRIPDSDARRSGRRRLARRADHADERAARHARFARPGLSTSCSRWPDQIELEDGPAIDNAAVQEKLAEFYVRSQGLNYTKYPRHDGAVARPDAGAGIVDHQGGGGEQAAGHPVVRARPDRHGGTNDGR